MILNLKPFNLKYVGKIHFKMESLKSAVYAMTVNFYFASVNLKEAFYSIKVRSQKGNTSGFIGEDININLPH